MERIVIGKDPFLHKDVVKLGFANAELPGLQVFNRSDVLVGNPSSNIALGVIHTWDEDEPTLEIRRFFRRVSNYSYLTGYWRTTNGARYVFSNILANPNVNALVLVVFGKRDNGHLLVDALVNFWKNGCDASGQIIGSIAPNPRFEQVPPDALERMRRQVDLVVIRQQTQEDVEKIIKAIIQEPEHSVPVPKHVELYSIGGKDRLYDDGARFDLPYELDLSKSAKTVHYEEKKSGLPLGQTVHAQHLEEALDMVASYIYLHGDAFVDQRGIETRESRSFTISIKDPLAAIPAGYSEKYLQNYLDEFMNGLPGADEFAYTYHERIFKRWGDQVETAISVLKKNPRTRRCMISLWDQTMDLETESPPCLNFIWLVIRDKVLELHVVYRSHHLATVTKDGKLMEGEGAMVPNLYALSHLQKRIAGRLNLETGPLVLTDFSGHIYVSGI